MSRFLKFDSLISDRHRKQYIEYYMRHEQISKPHAWQDVVIGIAKRMNATTVLDYGSGPEKSLEKFSGLNVTSYDPVIPHANPRGLMPFDLVVCHHVLEHVEPDKVDDVLEHLKELTKKALYFAVSTKPSTKTLPDGAPWHCSVHYQEWWRAKLESIFEGGLIELPAGKHEYVAVWEK